MAELREITETHPEAPTGELIAEVRRLVDNDDHCTSEHYNPERDRKRAELHLGYPPADLPANLASVDDVAAVCRAAGLTEQTYAATETSRTWTTAVGRVRIRAWFDGPTFYCVSPVDSPFGVDMFKDTPAVLLWHAIQAARRAS